MARERPTNEQLDQSLLQRIVERDADAIAQLKRRYASRLSAFIRHWISDPHLVEEVIQDVFWSVWNDAARFKGESRVSTWLLGIARYKALSAARQRWPEPIDTHPLGAIESGRSAAESETGSSRAPLSPTSEPERMMEQMESAATLREALGQLSPAHRATLELIFFHEMRLREAAEVMGCPEGTVKSRLSYAKRKLRLILERPAAAEADSGKTDWRRLP